MIELSDDIIQRLAQEHLQDFIDNAQEERYGSRAPWNPEKIDRKIEGLQGARSDIIDSILEKDFRKAHDLVDNLLEHHQIEAEKDSPQYNKLCDAVLATTAEGLKQHCRILEGGHTIEFTKPTSTAPTTTPASTIILPEVVEKMIEVKSPEWSAATRKDVPLQLREFAEIIGDIAISGLQRDHMRSYLQTMRKMPSRRSQITAYRNKTISELMGMDIPESKLLAAKTLETRFINVRSLLNWAEQEGYIEKASHLNKVLTVKDIAKKAKQKTRGPFSIEEMTMLFDQTHYHKSTDRGAAKFWLPIMAAFTGARGNELSQLHLNDIHEVAGVMVLDVNDEGDKKVKSEAGIRRIPVHPFLIEVGLLKRIESLHAAGHDRLFPKLQPDSKGSHFASISKWFTRHRRDAGVQDYDENGLKRVFHSFRHAFITRCKHLRLDREMYKEVVGHEKGEIDITDGYEGNFMPSQLLKDVVERIDFHEHIDLNHLKNSKWITKP